MNSAPAITLQRLRAKTDRELAVLVRRELDRGLDHLRQSRPCAAKRSYESAEVLLAMAEVSAADRARLEQKLDQLRAALPRCASAMSAA